MYYGKEKTSLYYYKSVYITVKLLIYCLNILLVKNITLWCQIAKSLHNRSMIGDDTVNLSIGQHFPPGANPALSKEQRGRRCTFGKSLRAFLCLKAVKGGKCEGVV